MSDKKVTEQKEKYVVFHVQGGLGKNIAEIGRAHV